MFHSKGRSEGDTRRMDMAGVCVEITATGKVIYLTSNDFIGSKYFS